MTDTTTRNRQGSRKAAAPDLNALTRTLLCDPFAVLGRHEYRRGRVRVRAFLPDTREARIVEGDLPLKRVPESDFFEWQGPAETLPEHYRIVRVRGDGETRTFHDPYAFPPLLSEFDLHLFREGRHWHAYRILGAHVREVDGVTGTLFAVWAPNAEGVSVVGDFNAWDGRRHPMRSRGDFGVWELFVPEVGPGTLYKFEIRPCHGGPPLLKTDPYGQTFELRPATAARVVAPTQYEWNDHDWLERRRHHDWLHAPLSVYEVHLGSWQRGPHGEFLGYRELAERLVPHVRDLGFTHIELLPVTEHPLDASWGYQTTGYYAPTSRHGGPDDFRYFVDHCHRHGIGVLLDWVPGHFPKDAFALARFDGTALYEHEDPRRGEHRDWGTYIYNYGRNEVRNFLLSSALFWLEEYHLDGLRVDAVASMLYLDYSREPGEWLPNRHGGNENLEAIDFLRELNGLTHGQHPGTLVIAEESTAWPQVTRPTWMGGLGFSMKWNMGWMNDTLDYMQREPVHRKFHHDKLTFGLVYAFTENFVLPLSHDEVVHGKRSLLGKMPGDEWQRFANLRLLYTEMFTHPGKKLLFMGAELAEPREWNHDRPLEWPLLEHAYHRGIQTLLGDLNRVYRDHPALHRQDFEHTGFEWIDCHDVDHSVVSFLRHAGDGSFVIVLLNFTPVPREGYRIGVPRGGRYREILNTDSAHYGGSNVGNLGALETEPFSCMGRAESLRLTLPPLGALVLAPEA